MSCVFDPTPAAPTRGAQHPCGGGRARRRLSTVGMVGVTCVLLSSLSASLLFIKSSQWCLWDVAAGHRIHRVWLGFLNLKKHHITTTTAVKRADVTNGLAVQKIPILQKESMFTWHRTYTCCNIPVSGGGDVVKTRLFLLLRPPVIIQRQRILRGQNLWSQADIYFHMLGANLSEKKDKKKNSVRRVRTAFESLSLHTPGPLLNPTVALIVCVGVNIL